MAKILGIDHGAVRIGIAVSDESSSIAFGREIILNNKDVFEKISKAVDIKIFKEMLGESFEPEKP